MRFVTEYINGGNIYGSHVYAKDWEHALELCKRRGIGECVTGENTEDLKPNNDSVNCLLHEACFLSFICLSAKLVTPEQILGDHGIVHEISHLISIENASKPSLDLIHKMQWLRSITPGYEPV